MKKSLQVFAVLGLFALSLVCFQSYAGTQTKTDQTDIGVMDYSFIKADLATFSTASAVCIQNHLGTLEDQYVNVLNAKEVIFVDVSYRLPDKRLLPVREIFEAPRE